MMENNTNEVDELDGQILANASLAIVNSEEGSDMLAQAANGTKDPAAGVAQYVMMLMQAVSDMLEQAGIQDVDPSAWLAKGGAMDIMMPELLEALQDGGVAIDETFAGRLTDALLERIKGVAQSEGGAGPAAAPAPQGEAPVGSMTAQADGLLGMV